MKGNKLYTTKEMKPAAVEDAADVMSSFKPKEAKFIIQEKRNTYIVRNLEGIRLGKFLTKKDAEDFGNKL